MAVCLTSDDLETYIGQYGAQGGTVRLAFLVQTVLQRVKAAKEAAQGPASMETTEESADNANTAEGGPMAMETTTNGGPAPVAATDGPTPMEMGGGTPMGTTQGPTPMEGLEAAMGSGVSGDLSFVTESHRVLLDLIKRTSNTKLYTETLANLKEFGLQQFAADNLWVETTDKQNNQLHDIYEQDLNQAKTSQNKEGIRMALINLANFWVDRGVYQQALKHYVKAREYQMDHNLSMTMLKLNAFLSYYPEVHSYASKLHLPSSDTSIVSASQGLFYLGTGKYRDAALVFVNSNGNISGLNEVMTPLDACVYTSLLALASLDRSELNKLMENSNYQERLSSIPLLHSIVTDFVECRYGRALQELTAIKPRLSLDIHLAAHVEPLCMEIRQKAITRFFVPFESVSLRTIAAAFHTTVDEIHKEVATLIGNNQIMGKIDSQQQVLHARRPNERLATFKRTLAVGDEILQSTKALILRVNMLKYEFVSSEGNTQRTESRVKR
eukprot:GEMP01022892.1.p1 GENE.GEMP01022892.1~~GEMP01022892.1.p1  ORF type:complete len:498 (+),score=75.70 GEMP01022892.1:146-1639(+)